MINVLIYMNKEEEARSLALALLEKQLVANISIDFNNHVYSAFKGQLQEEVNCLLTAQTKALLFREILEVVQNRLQDHVRIYSTPITQCNDHFSDLIRTRIKAV